MPSSEGKKKRRARIRRWFSRWCRRRGYSLKEVFAMEKIEGVKPKIYYEASMELLMYSVKDTKTRRANR